MQFILFGVCILVTFLVMVRYYYTYQQTILVRIIVTGPLPEICIKVILPDQFLQKFTRKSSYIFLREELCPHWGYGWEDTTRFRTVYVYTLEDKHKQVSAICRQLLTLKEMTQCPNIIIKIFLY